jgi:hypothetical protein
LRAKVFTTKVPAVLVSERLLGANCAGVISGPSQLLEVGRNGLKRAPDKIDKEEIVVFLARIENGSIKK